MTEMLRSYASKKLEILRANGRVFDWKNTWKIVLYAPSKGFLDKCDSIASFFVFVDEK